MSISATSRHRRISAVAVTAIALAATAATFGVGTASPRAASAHHEVFHFYLKNESTVFRTASGKVFHPSQANPPKPGDSEERNDLEYVGTRANHAKHWTASDEDFCIFNAKGDPVCHAEVAIGGSMVVADHTFSKPQPDVTYHVTGGTGKFHGMHGKIVIRGNNSEVSNANVTISLH
jgi:hypothetical protein